MVADNIARTEDTLVGKQFSSLRNYPIRTYAKEIKNLTLRNATFAEMSV